MADTLTVTERSERMSLVRGRANRSTEMRMVALLRQHGFRGWRRGVTLIGKPDFVFRRERVALFVDGCFWHGCPKHTRIPKSRVKWWAAKLERNQVRDRLVTRALRKAGWTVVRVWECDLAPQLWPRVARRVGRAVGRTE